MKKNRNMHQAYRLASYRSIVLGFVSLVLFSVSAQATDLKSIVNQYSRAGYSIGVVVQDADTGEILFNHNGEKGFNPASTMKVVTSTAALYYLSGSYTYGTSLQTDGFSNGTIKNLYLKGVGDPSLVEERLWRMAKDLRVRGVRRVDGDIIIDNSYFDNGNFAGKDASSTRAYNAGLSALALNFNSFAVVAKNYGGRLEVHVDPPTEYFQLKSNIRGSGNGIAVSRVAKEGREYVQASGGVSTEKVKYANVVNPVLYAGTTFGWVLNQMGIQFNGKVTAGKAMGQVLFVDQSKPMSLILRDLNKWSNNFTAEMVLKTLGAVKGSLPGSTEKGLVLLNQYLQKIGAPSGQYQIFNGSGLSRRNQLSPKLLSYILYKTFKNNQIREDFISTLAIAAKDGTLKNRLRSPNLAGNVKAKTGTLNDVSSLAGYIETKGEKTLAFSILVNGAGAGSGGFFSMQEKLLNQMYNAY